MATLFVAAVSLGLGLQQIAVRAFWLRTLGVLTIRSLHWTIVARRRQKRRAALRSFAVKVRALSAGILSHLFVVISHSAMFFLLPFYLQGIFVLARARSASRLFSFCW